MSAVHNALGSCPEQRFPLQAGREMWYSCPACPPLLGSQLRGCTVCLGFGFVHFLQCRYSWPRGVFACMSLFEDTGRINTPRESVQGTEMLLDFHPPQCMR